MRVRVNMGSVGPLYLEVEQCRCCHDLVSVATQPLDVHGHCPQCQEPREVKCDGCHTLWREDLVDPESQLCPSCQLDDDVERERAAAEE